METPRKKLTLEEAAILIDGGCPEGFALEATSGENGLAHAWNDTTDGSLCGAVAYGTVPAGSQIRPWDDMVDCPGCLSLMSAAKRMDEKESPERRNATAEEWAEAWGTKFDSLEGCRESDRIAEGLDAMGKPNACSKCGGTLQQHEYTTGHHTWDCTAQTIDLTPVGCQTPEGRKRVEDAQREWDSATHLIANTLKEFIDSGVTLHRPDYAAPDRESMHQINSLIGARDRKQEAFLKAVSGR